MILQDHDFVVFVYKIIQGAKTGAAFQGYFTIDMFMVLVDMPVLTVQALATSARGLL